MPTKDEDQLPISSSTPPEFAPEQEQLFREVLTLLNESGVPFVISGAFALREHTGICRDTKDLDVFLPPENVRDAMIFLQQHGYECEVADPVWLAKAHRGDFFVDLITGMSTGTVTVDQTWVERSTPSVIFDVPIRVLGPEELIASKLFVTRRERFDGADIVHVIHGTRGKIDWDWLFLPAASKKVLHSFLVCGEVPNWRHGDDRVVAFLFIHFRDLQIEAVLLNSKFGGFANRK